MPLPLRSVLADDSLATSDPMVLAARDQLGRLVRWVHTSEVLDIGGLLRGGELLLVGGVSLASATPHQRRAYVMDLASHDLTALAIETGDRLPVVPPEMVEEAERVHLPLIELRKVVRFVEVTESINGLLVNESVRRLQLADLISHALAAALAEGGGADELLTVLGRETGALAVLTSVNGEVIAESRSATGDCASGTLSDRPVVASVTLAGVTVATLALHPVPGSDLLLLDAACDRAPEAIGLALLRSRPLSRLERDAHEFLTIARGGIRSRRRFAELAERIGLAGHDTYVPVVARLERRQILTAAIDGALQRSGRRSVSQVLDDTYVSVVGARGPATSVHLARAALVRDLADTPLPPGIQVAVGPASRSLDGLERGLREAEVSLDLTDDGRQGVVDAAEVGVGRLISAIDRAEPIDAFIQEYLGELLDIDRRRHSALFETLAMYLRHQGSKTDAAAALHLQRQSLYQRLERIMAALGDPPPGSVRWGAITVAVELEGARRASSWIRTT